ncbi:hypothetical protein [Rhizobium hidalgonense]|uniref:hypothetical protein n=1 Tax=Rhizobium hidalgonense TaxID=1538159 RepID=UPI001105B3AF|nr:hypothetical protein [Rhizobium hidalgonense]QKK25927.1 hypothetical protein FFM81_028370 [Rhizobium hidalgonense]
MTRFADRTLLRRAVYSLKPATGTSAWARPHAEIAGTGKANHVNMLSAIAHARLMARSLRQRA